MTDRQFTFDTPMGSRNYVDGRIRLTAESFPVPNLKVEVMYVDEGGDDDADICEIDIDNLDTLARIRDALNQILGD